jgi:hypothetical protein
LDARNLDYAYLVPWIEPQRRAAVTQAVRQINPHTTPPIPQKSSCAAGMFIATPILRYENLELGLGLVLCQPLARAANNKLGIDRVLEDPDVHCWQVRGRAQGK